MRHSQRGLDGKVTSAVVLAGGLGTRLRGVLHDLPKPLAPVAGRAFLEYQLDYWIAQGIGRFVLSVGYLHEVIVDHFGDRYRGAELDYAIERTPLGTGGGLRLAAQHIDGRDPFLVLNGDTWFPVDLKILDGFARDNDADWCLSLTRTSENGRYMGVGLSAEGRIVSLQSEASPLVNGGVYWVHPRVLGALAGGVPASDKISLEDDVLPAAVAEGRRLFGREFSGPFIDIGLPEDYRRAQEVLPC